MIPTPKSPVPRTQDLQGFPFGKWNMADDDDISEGELEEEEKEAEQPGIDYEEVDEATGFKKPEWKIWKVGYV